ncbi:hypothetical protein QCA50_008781 [Cerrena zonata]|uniref:Uncharacterized protein n=1 Tax=Cerrena zonata TaxID=2478898 RepID=A0AAW0G511_9APHY
MTEVNPNAPIISDQSHQEPESTQRSATQTQTTVSTQGKDRPARGKQVYGWLIDEVNMNHAPYRLGMAPTPTDNNSREDTAKQIQAFREFMWDLESKVMDIVPSARFATVWNPETRDYSRFLGVNSEPPPDQLEALRVAISESSLTIGEPGWYYLR